MRTRKIIILISALLGIAAYFYAGGGAKFAPPSKLESGDLVFRKENSFWGDLSSAAARVDGKYSHVGMIYIEHGQPVVIHAYADTNKKEAKVARQTLEEFFENASAVGFYRFNFPQDIREEIANKAFEYHERKVPFDDKFSIEDDSAVYCTELVWRAAKAGSGYDVAPVKSTLIERQFIGNDDLFLGGFMNEIK